MSIQNDNVNVWMASVIVSFGNTSILVISPFEQKIGTKQERNFVKITFKEDQTRRVTNG